MTTKKDLSDIVREGMQDTNIPLKETAKRKTPTPKVEENEELASLKLKLDEEKERVKYLQKQVQEQQEQVNSLSQALEEKQEKEKKQFIVPVGMNNHLVILPSTSTVLTNEEIGWFD